MNCQLAHYTVTARRQGLRKSPKKETIVTAGGRLTVDFRLEVGASHGNRDGDCASGKR